MTSVWFVEANKVALLHADFDVYITALSLGVFRRKLVVSCHVRWKYMCNNEYNLVIQPSSFFQAWDWHSILKSCGGVIFLFFILFIFYFLFIIVMKHIYIFMQQSFQ